jgi:thiamine-phosphate pyrophosphorylase
VGTIDVIATIMIPNLAVALRLLLVTDDALLGKRDPLLVIQDAVRGGVTSVQLRLKLASDRELLRLAELLVTKLPIPVFINDRLDVALAAGAAGCHLGPDDLSPTLAAPLVGPDFVIGASVGAIDEMPRALRAHYWGIGPLHSTGTKVDAGHPLGLAGAAALLSHAGGRACVVIGGVQPVDVEAALHAGFSGVAVSGGILRHSDVEAAARRYISRG